MLVASTALEFGHAVSFAACRLTAVLLVVGIAAPAIADGMAPASRGQTVYVPIYSEIRHGNISSTGKTDTALMSVLVSVRNTDPNNAIRVLTAPYYNTGGMLLHNALAAPKVIPPFGTLELFVELRENAGGSGANYVVMWEAGTAVSPPIVEALHSRFQAGYSMAFISRGQAISEP